MLERFQVPLFIIGLPLCVYVLKVLREWYKAHEMFDSGSLTLFGAGEMAVSAQTQLGRHIQSPSSHQNCLRVRGLCV